jgi:cyclophilin family peptidyl-prolyl cis-trans isomerase
MKGRNLMKRKSLLVFLLVTIFSLSSYIFADEINDLLTIKLKIGSKSAFVNEDQKVLDAPPIIQNGRTLVPLRFIGESLGADITYTKETQEIILKFTDLTKLKEKLTEKEKEIKELKDQAETDKASISTLTADLEKKNTETEDLKKQISSLQGDIKKLQAQIKKLQKDIADCRDSNEVTTLKRPTIKQIRQMQKEWIEFNTTMGVIVIELNPEAAPVTCLNFRSLVEEGFYDGIIFHRVIKDFMIQSGGQTAIEQHPQRYSFMDEINPLKLDMKESSIGGLEGQGYQYDFNLPSIKHLQGVISMANAGPNTNFSQFFIVTKSDGTDWLNGRHTVFGKVVKGMDVVLSIEKVSTEQGDKPKEDVTILSAKIIEKKG